MNFSQFFSKMQESNWYFQFLAPVIKEIEQDTSLLDIGTGSGKLLELLHQQKKINAIGVDTNQEMLDEGKLKLQHIEGIKLHKIEAGEALTFENNSFDYVSICNVLFNLKEEAVLHLLDESKRLLKKGGKIIILTPTGKGGLLKLTRKFFSLDNRSIYIWYSATKKNGKNWLDKGYLTKYAKQNDFTYTHKVVLDGFAQLETLTYSSTFQRPLVVS